jgi:hypothetical protein
VRAQAATDAAQRVGRIAVILALECVLPATRLAHYQQPDNEKRQPIFAALSTPTPADLL